MGISFRFSIMRSSVAAAIILLGLVLASEAFGPFGRGGKFGGPRRFGKDSSSSEEKPDKPASLWDLVPEPLKRRFWRNTVEIRNS